MCLLHKDIAKGNLTSLTEMFSKGVKFDLRTKNGDTITHVAAKCGITTFKNLFGMLNDKIDVNVRNNQGQTPLHTAVICNQVQVVGFLLRNSADRTLRDNKGQQPYALAIDSQNPELKTILKLPDLDKDGTLDDIPGLSSKLKNELRMIANCYKSPRECEIRNIQVPTVILLTGPPGVGKTMIVRCLSNELQKETGHKFQFEALYASSFIASTVGTASAKIAAKFEEARKNAPTILFLDEIDTIAGVPRSDNSSSAAVENNRDLVSLLIELDGFHKHPDRKVIFVCATNFAKNLDPAFISRVHETKECQLPNLQERQAILQYYLDRIPVALVSDSCVQNLAKRTHNYPSRLLRTLIESANRETFNQDPKAVLNDNSFDEVLIRLQRQVESSSYKSPDSNSLSQ